MTVIWPITTIKNRKRYRLRLKVSATMTTMMTSRVTKMMTSRPSTKVKMAVKVRNRLHNSNKHRRLRRKRVQKCRWRHRRQMRSRSTVATQFNSNLQTFQLRRDEKNLGREVVKSLWNDKRKTISNQKSHTTKRNIRMSWSAMIHRMWLMRCSQERREKSLEALWNHTILTCT